MLSSDSDTDYVTCPSADESSSSDSFISFSQSLNEKLVEQFTDAVKNFNVVHINAQSVPAHFPDILTSFDIPNLHAILISESWLKPSLPSSSYTLPGFSLIRNDRIGKGGGGVAIYLRSYFPFRIISSSEQPPPSNAAEHILIEVLVSSQTNVLLGVCYSPSVMVDFFFSFETLLEKFTPSYKHTIIMGDFNTCLLKHDSRAKKLSSLVESCNLQLLQLQPTHTVPGCNPSLIDLILVSSPSFVSHYGQLQADAFSYHDLLFLSYSIRPLKPKSRILLQRNFKDMDTDRLREDAIKTNWSSIMDVDDVDDKIDLFNNFLLQLYNTHAPIRSIKQKHCPAPWLTEEIKCLLNKKNRAKAKLRLSKCDANVQKYKVIRNRCNTICRDAQRRHIHKAVENGDSARVWKFLKSLGVGKSHYSQFSLSTNFDLMNNHFSNSSTAFDIATKNSTILSLSALPTPSFPPFLFTQFTDSDVDRAIRSISSNAIGSDGISRRMILPILDIITTYITHIFNTSLLTKFPDTWKDAYIIPLPKKTNPSEFSDYRPISVLPLLSKALERLVSDQLSIYLNKNNLLHSFQSGFRPCHSTVTALAKISDDVREGMDNRQLTILVLLDFSNAFNTVDFDVLLGILRSINVSPTVVEWFHSYLLGRRQRIRVEDRFSSWCENSAGVPQGGVLSPLLFSIFINTITNEITSPFHLYADDFQIYARSSLEDLPSAIQDMNINLDCIYNWSKRFGLLLNPLKTQAIIFGSQNLTSRVEWDNLPLLLLNNTNIPFSNVIKNLGIYMDCNLSWSTHVKEISKRMYAAAGSLRRLRNFLPMSTRVMLAQALLLPILDYGDACFVNVTEEQLAKLERLQNFCIRFVFGLRKYDHVSDFRAKLKWLPIRFRRNTHVLRLLYSVLFDPRSPPYLKERFRFVEKQHKPQRACRSLLLELPVHSTKFYSTSFTVTAVKLWNALPLDIRRAQTVNSFMSMIKRHYLSLLS